MTLDKQLEKLSVSTNLHIRTFSVTVPYVQCILVGGPSSASTGC